MSRMHCILRTSWTDLREERAEHVSQIVNIGKIYVEDFSTARILEFGDGLVTADEGEVHGREIVGAVTGSHVEVDNVVFGRVPGSSVDRHRINHYVEYMDVPEGQSAHDLAEYRVPHLWAT